MKHERLLGWGCLAFVAVMPLHAFLVIWAGHLFGHMNVFQAWKEILLVALSLVAGLAVFHQPKLRQRLLKPYNYAAVILVLTGLAVSLAVGNTGSTAWWFGLKTNFAMILAFLIGQVAANLALRRLLLRTLMGASLAVAVFAILQAWVLPADFLRSFGYGFNTIAPVQKIDPTLSIRRAFSTLGGPNQLGAFLILPISYLVAAASKKLRRWHLPAGITLGLGLVATFSRSAWLGATIAVVITAVLGLDKAKLTKVAGAFAIVAVIGAAAWFGPARTILEPVISHNRTVQTSSDEERLGSQQAGLRRIAEQPFGSGLGTAGPASFHGQKPFITENFYLQIAVETGLIGLAAYLTWQYLTFRRLLNLKDRAVARAWAGAIIGIGIVNLLLHGWADSTLALVYWTIAGIAVGDANV